MKMNINDLFALQEKLESRAALWKRHWDGVSVYVMPDIKDVWTTAQGPQSRPECLDSTAIDANILLASSMHMSFTSQAAEWFRIQVRDSKLMKSVSVREYCQECTRRMFDAFAMSNFYQSMFAGWLNLPAFGTSALFVEDRNNDGILRTRSVPIYNIFPVENWDGLIDTVFVKEKYSKYKICQRWPRAKSIPCIEKNYDKNPFEEIDVLHYVGPVEDWPVLNKEHKFVSVYLIKEDKEILNKIGEEYEGYQEFPYMVDRWSVLSGETYGTGPGINCLPHIMSLMRTIEMKFEALGLVINPPVMSTEDNLQAIGENGKIGPGVQMLVRDMNNTKPWVSGANIAVAELSEEKLQEKIERMFFTRELLLTPDRPEMTAYETSKRVELVHRLLGPTSNRVQRERLNPTIERTFGIMARAGKLPPIPDELRLAMDSDSDILDIEYVSPLARAQRYNEVQAAQELLSVVVQAAQYDPLYLEKINFNSYIDFIAERTGVPISILANQKDFEKRKNERQQMMEQQAQLQQLETIGGAAQRFGRAAQSAKQVGVM